MRTRLRLAAICLLAAACRPTSAAPTLTPPAPTSKAPTAIPTPSGPPLTPPPNPRPGAIANGYSLVHYCTDGAEVLRLDLYVPLQLARDPAPAVINTGGGMGGEELTELTRRGYVVASLAWREPPPYKLPIGIEDAKCAVRFLRARAADFHIDPDHIGAWGCSHGGYMAAMLGLTDPGAGFDGSSGFEDQSSQVQAVVVMDGIASFRTNYSTASGAPNTDLATIHGIPSLDDSLVDLLSPITYVSPGDPPVLILVSEGDNRPPAWQPKSEMQLLHDELMLGGVPVTLVEIPNATHCDFPSPASPSTPTNAALIADFFDQQLK